MDVSNYDNAETPTAPAKNRFVRLCVLKKRGGGLSDGTEPKHGYK